MPCFMPKFLPNQFAYFRWMQRVLHLLLFFLPAVAFTQQEKDAYQLGVEGVTLIDEGSFDEGIKLLKQARNIEPADFDYSFEIGRAYLKNGSAKKAEKFLFPLQYHVNVQPDLFVALANCYSEINKDKKTPDPEKKKELDALRYGIQKFPNAGVLYFELAKRKVDLDETVEALAVFETGIQKAPNFAENYFWASKLLKASGNYLWGWFYAEICLNMTDDPELIRSCAILTSQCSQAVFKSGWDANPEQLDQSLRLILAEKCNEQSPDLSSLVEKRKCLLTNWSYKKFAPVELFNRMELLEERGFLEPYLASLLNETDKASFLQWVPNNIERFEAYRNWRYWNPMTLKKPVNRLLNY